MAKKKERKIFNIDEVNIEIDYDKLADAIVKANEKQANQYSISREWMKFVIFPIFFGSAVISGFLGIGFGIYAITTLGESMSSSVMNPEQFFTGFISFLLCLYLIGICLFTFFTGREIDKEADKQYVATMFSNVVALVALVVSLVALVKG